MTSDIFIILQDKGNYTIEYVFNNNLTKTDFMFFNCDKIIKLDLSKFDTQNVTNMNSMFWNCYWLNNIDLTNLILKILRI